MKQEPTNTRTIAIIPARFASTRFPGKPLALIGGKTMIQRVYEQALLCKLLSEVWVATDDDRIEAEVLRFGGKVVRTSEACPSGTDRCAEALMTIQTSADVVINIQGDEPFIKVEQISQLVSLMATTQTQIGTLCKQINELEEIFDPNVVKVVRSADSKALYFSRNPIPYVRGEKMENWPAQALYLKHIGLYAYQTRVLPQLTRLPVGMLEKAERLEQLRWLEAGFEITLTETEWASFGIDTPADLDKANRHLQE